MKNYADLGECYPPRPSASVDNTRLDLQNSSYPTQPHSIIAKYSYSEKCFHLLRSCIFPTWQSPLVSISVRFCDEWLINAPIKSKLQHPPPRVNPGNVNFWRLDRSNSRPLGPKWCSNALPPKEQSSSVPVVCNKACVHSQYTETSIQDGKLF